MPSTPILIGAVLGAAVALILAVVAWRRPWRGARTRYPIVLAHGVMGFDRIELGPFGLDYFNGVAAHLEGLGVTVIRPRVPMVGSVEARARALAAAVAAIPSRRVNIIAHSMGGLDARYAITHLGLRDRVAALVTIGTPHHGTPTADVGTLGLGKLLSAVGIAAFNDLTTDVASVFNREVPNARRVLYASVVANAPRDGARLNPLFRLLGVLARRSADSDGLVPVASQAWGRVWLRIEADHWAQIGWSKQFDATVLYERLARRLRARRL